MMLSHADPAAGFLTLHPMRDMGCDLAVAHYCVGGRVARPLSPVHAWGIVDNAGRGRRLTARGITAARREAAAHGLPVTLCRAVGRGVVTLWERVERLHDDAACPRSQLVAPTGVLVVKAVDPVRLQDSKALSRQLAGALREIDRARLAPALTEYVARLDVPWGSLSANAAAAVWDDAEDWLRARAGAPLLPRWQETINTTLTTVAAATRKDIREQFLPRIGTSFRREETAALDRIGTQQGWFLRDHNKAISRELTVRGRQIVADGLRQGWGRVEIGKQLREQLPGMWGARNAQYANVVAANAVSRARSHAELASYRDGGVEYMEVQAVLDERTTEICRFMDGHIISVADAYGVSEAAANVQRPEDIYDAAPFMQAVWTNAEGRRLGPKEAHLRDHRELHTTRGARVAIIDRSGLGRKDDPGQFRALMGGNKFHDAHVGPPPYHHLCRSFTVPRVDIYQVPRGYVGVTNTDIVMPAGSAASGLHPVAYHVAPTPAAPLMVGRPPLLDVVPVHALMTDPLRFPELLRLRQEWATVQTLVRSPTAPALTPLPPRTATSDDLAALLQHRPTAVFRGMAGHQDAVLLLGARAPLSSEQIVALVTHPAALGRDLVVRVGARSRTSEQWLRITAGQAPRRALQTGARGITQGQWTAKEADRWIAQAKRDGWLRVGTKLDDVAAAPGVRGAIVAPPPTPPGPPPPPPSVAIVPAGDTAALGMRDLVVPPKLYTARPSPAMVTKAVRAEVPHGYLRVGTSSGKPLPKLGRWSRMDIGPTTGIPDLGTNVLRVADDAALVHLWVPGVLGRNDVRRLYSRIISTELDRGFAGIREYVIQDARGVSWFVRYNGAAAQRLPRATINAAQQNLFAGGTAGDEALAFLRAGVADSTATLQQFYPRAAVDWQAQTGLLPGVPLREQALRRTAAVREEIEAAIVKHEAAGLTGDKAVGRAIFDALGRDAAPGPASKGMRARGRQNTTGRRKLSRAARQEHVRVDRDLLTMDYSELSKGFYRWMLDDALGSAAPALRTSAAQLPAPHLLRSEVNTRAYYTARAPRQTPPAIVMGKYPTRGTAMHEYTHHLERTGLSGPAARLVRNQRLTDGRLVDIYGDGREWGLPGPYRNAYSAKLYGVDLDLAKKAGLRVDHQASVLRPQLDDALHTSVLDATYGAGEYLTVASEDVYYGLRKWKRIANYERMSAAWAADPDQLSVYIATMRGAFVP